MIHACSRSVGKPDITCALSQTQTSGGSGGAVNLVVTGRAFYALLQQHEHLVERYTERTGSTPVKIMECITPLHMVLTQAGIFSRMSPQHKMELMRSLQNLGYVVCMYVFEAA